MSEHIFECKNEQQQQQWGALLAEICTGHSLQLFLHGDLGAGKTTLTRGILQGLGYTGKVKSPTYSVIEIYPLPQQTVLHVDLYRIHNAAEISALGLIEQIALAQITIIEWAEKAAEQLPSPDLSCYISPFREGRQLRLIAHTPQGENFLAAMVNTWKA